MVKVVKFGGSSLASAGQFAKAGDIIGQKRAAGMSCQVRPENEMQKI